MFKYTLWIPEKETLNDLFLTVNADSKIEALLRLRHKYRYQLLEFNDDELLNMIVKNV